MSNVDTLSGCWVVFMIASNRRILSLLEVPSEAGWLVRILKLSERTNVCTAIFRSSNAAENLSIALLPGSV